MKSVLCSSLSMCVLAAVWIYAPQLVDMLAPYYELRPQGESAVVASEATKKVRETVHRASEEDTSFDALAGDGENAEAADLDKVTAKAEGESSASSGDFKVEQVNYRKAKWCVLMREVKVSDLDGNYVGDVKGGRFFVIDEIKRNGRQSFAVGNFVPKALPKTVQFAAEKALYLSGSPDDLTDEQKDALRNYYEICGKIAKRRDEILAEAGSKSPYFAEAVAANKAFKVAAAKVKTDEATADAPSEKYKLEELKNKVTSLMAKHKKWKEEHKDEVEVDVEADDEIKSLREELDKCTTIEGSLRQPV